MKKEGHQVTVLEAKGRITMAQGELGSPWSYITSLWITVLG